MKHLFILSILCSFAILTGQEVTTTKATVTSSSVIYKTSWNDKAALKPDVFVKKTFEALAEEYYIEHLDKIFEEIISETTNKKNQAITKVKKIYFFVKPSIDYYPEALITFSVTTVNYPEEIIKNPKLKVAPSVVIKLDSPCKLYTDYFDFAMDKFNLNSVKLSITARSTGTQWSVQQNFSLKNLFLVTWLSSVKKTLRIFNEPKVHPILLFFKQRFDHVSGHLYEKLK